MVARLCLPSAVETSAYAVLAPSGQLVDGAAPMDHDEALTALEWMLLTRTFDERAISLQRQGRFGTFSSARGQEGSVCGAASALDPRRDWVVPQYRELPALVRQGFPLENLALYFMGHPAGCRIPADVKMLPIQISLAAQIPQAVGLAWGLRRQGSDGVVVVFFGDGASSEGDFHEAVNLAGVLKAPVVFFLQNNGWAISTPRERQSAARTLASRAVGYGVAGAYVDGNDLFAVNEVMRDAVARARAGEGPTLVESLTWRVAAHNTADDPTKYQTADDHLPWSGTDPIERVQRYLADVGVWTDEVAAATEARCRAEVDRALAAAQAVVPAGPEALFDHVYADEPPRFSQQREAWTARAGGGEAR